MSKTKPFQYPKGIRLEEPEAEFIAGALMALAEGAKQSNDAKLFNTSMELAQRIRHSVMHAKGVPPELQQRLQKGMERAVQSKNPERAQRAMENFLATMIRLHPDPARALAQFVVSYVTQAVTDAIEPAATEAGLQSAGALIDLVVTKLEGLRDDYETSEDGFPESDDMIEFLIAWFEFGSKQLEKGDEPWSSDEHIERARAEQDQGDDDQG